MATLHARLCLLFTPSLCRDDAWATLAAALRGGVDLVQWRVKATPRPGLARCLAACAAAGVPCIVNDDPSLAVEVGAAGAHIGQDDLPAPAARAVLGPTRWLGVSTHDVGQIRAAIAAGADYVGFGPCFPTATKGYVQGQDDGAIAAAVAATTLPLFAIGGITAANLPRLRALGCARIAVSAAILAAADPERAAAALRTALG